MRRTGTIAGPNTSQPLDEGPATPLFAYTPCTPLSHHFLSAERTQTGTYLRALGITGRWYETG